MTEEHEEHDAAIARMTDEQLQRTSANVSANLQDPTIPEAYRQIDLRMLIAIQVEQISRQQTAKGAELEDPCRVIRSHSSQSEQWRVIDQERTHALSRELDLGQHTLLLMSDGSTEVIAHEEQASCWTSNRVSLTSEETYRLFLSLQEQFR